MIGIYKITNPNEKIYIGQSIDIKRRFRNYKRLSDCKKQTALYNSFMKYGVENHKFEILTECTIEELNNLERYYQDLYDVTNSKIGLNCVLTKSDEKSGKISKDTIEKNRIAQLKRFENPDSRIKCSIAQKKRFENPEEIEKNRQAQKKLYENGYVNPNKGIKKTDEQRKKNSDIQKELYKNGRIHPMSKMVINTQNGFMYNNAKEAWIAANLKCDIKHFHSMLAGRRINKTNFEYIKNVKEQYS
jgi:group I intron endonuclease